MVFQTGAKKLNKRLALSKIAIDAEYDLAKQWADWGDPQFLSYGFDEQYPDLFMPWLNTVVKSREVKEDISTADRFGPISQRSEMPSINFAGDSDALLDKLAKEYPSLLSDVLAKHGNLNFLHYKFNQEFPHDGKTFIAALYKKRPRMAKLFRKWIRGSSDVLAPLMSKALDVDFFKLGFDEEKYADYLEPFAKKWAKDNDLKFFRYDLHLIGDFRYAELGEHMAQKLADNASRQFMLLELAEAYPDLEERYYMGATKQKDYYRKSAAYSRFIFGNKAKHFPVVADDILEDIVANSHVKRFLWGFFDLARNASFVSALGQEKLSNAFNRIINRFMEKPEVFFGMDIPEYNMQDFKAGNLDLKEHISKLELALKHKALRLLKDKIGTAVYNQLMRSGDLNYMIDDEFNLKYSIEKIGPEEIYDAFIDYVMDTYYYKNAVDYLKERKQVKTLEQETRYLEDPKRPRDPAKLRQYYSELGYEPKDMPREMLEMPMDPEQLEQHTEGLGATLSMRDRRALSKRAELEDVHERNERLRKTMPGKYVELSIAPFEAFYEPTEEEAIEMANNEPQRFVEKNYGKLFPSLSHTAWENFIRTEETGPKSYFLFGKENPELDDLRPLAVENLIKWQPEYYFLMGLFMDKDMAKQVEQAVFSLLSQDPKRFLSIYGEFRASELREHGIIANLMEPFVMVAEDRVSQKKQMRLEQESGEERSSIWKRLTRQAKKPSYTKKEKTESGGYVWHYSDEHVKKRWADKKKKIEKLEKNLDKVRKEYEKDLSSDDERTRAIACIVGVMDTTAMRVGNPESAKEAGTYGATTLKVRHVSFKGNKAHFKFKGKGGIEQDTIVESAKVTKVLKELVKEKGKDTFIFEVDGKKINDKAVNRYLKKFDISAKDIRGFHANRLMKEVLKKKDFTDALEEVAETVGHKPATLKNQYLLPELVEKHEKKEKDKKEKEKDKGDKKDKKKKAALSIRAYKQVEQKDIGGEELKSEEFPNTFMGNTMQSMPSDPTPVNIYKNIDNIYSKAKVAPLIVVAWKTLAPFLPEGASMSSGFRSAYDQAWLIVRFWHKKWDGFFAKNYPGKGKSVGSMHKTMMEYNKTPHDQRPPGGPEKVSIDLPGKSGHQQMKAFDVSRTNLDKVIEAVNLVNHYLRDFINLSAYDERPAQNVVHITVNKAVYPGPQAMEHALRQVQSKQTFSSNVRALSKRAELTQEESSWIDSIKQKLFGTRTLSRRDYTPNGLEKIEIDPEIRKQLGIRKGVGMTPLIYDAWRTFKPFLPRGAVATSGIRTIEGQKKTLRNYWHIATKKRLPQRFWDENWENLPMWKEISKRLKQYGYIVGPPVRNPKAVYGHGKGNSVDISGADLDEIAAAVKMVSNHPELPVKIAGLLIERQNNAVHVNVKSATYDENAVAKVLQGRRGFGFLTSNIEKRWLEVTGTKIPDCLKSYGSVWKKAEEILDEQDADGQALEGVYQDLLESDPPEEILEMFKHLEAGVCNECIVQRASVPHPFGLHGDTYEDVIAQLSELPGFHEQKVGTGDFVYMTGMFDLADEIDLMWIFMDKRNVPVGEREIGYRGTIRVAYPDSSHTTAYSTVYQFDSLDPYEVIDNLKEFLENDEIKSDIVSRIHEALGAEIIEFPKDRVSDSEGQGELAKVIPLSQRSNDG